jgi:cytochrome c oxidase subunit 2
VTGLWWWMFGAGSVIWLAVATLAIVAACVHRGTPGASGEDDRPLVRVITAGVIITAGILAVFLVYDFSVGRLLAQRPAQSLTISLVGHQWWWEVVYEDSEPARRITTANEIHIPAGQTVQFKLTAADVIHSFWVPNLDGKRDLIPGYTSTIWFRADTPGVYRGQCAEFCGLQHAKMALYIVAESPRDFAAWRAAQSASPPAPGDSAGRAGQNVFMATGCPLCHNIGGTTASATVGPDLSHVASRMTIAAGSLPNTPAQLAQWIRDPSAIKPGARMPALPLSPAELHALVAYLETLK